MQHGLFQGTDHRLLALHRNNPKKKNKTSTLYFVTFPIEYPSRLSLLSFEHPTRSRLRTIASDILSEFPLCFNRIWSGDLNASLGDFCPLELES